MVVSRWTRLAHAFLCNKNDPIPSYISLTHSQQYNQLTHWFTRLYMTNAAQLPMMVGNTALHGAARKMSTS